MPAVDNSPQATPEKLQLPTIRPRLRMQRHIVKWMMGTSVLSVLVCLVIINLFARVTLHDKLRIDGDMLIEMVSASLSDRAIGQPPHISPVIVESLRRHPNVAFLCLTDRGGRILYTGVFKPKLWQAFQRQEREAFAEGRLEVPLPDMVKLDPSLVVQTRHVRASARAAALRSSGATAEDLEGVVLLGLHDLDIDAALWQVQTAQLLIVAVVAMLCFPISRGVVRKWAGPLRELLLATQRLARGVPPMPVAITTNDELGFLSAAFNDMAGRLVASRNELIAANAMLEKRIQERTRDLQEAVQQLERVASTDPLTGLANRRACSTSLEEMFRRSVRDQSNLACVMIDLDGFKLVNDKLGHDTGDRVLTLVASVLTESCRRTDVIGRLGGDEFIVLMPNVDEETARQIGDRVLAHFKEQVSSVIADSALADGITMSAGLASIERCRPETPSELLSQADAALYRAKDSGRACLRIHEESKVA